MSEYKSCFFIGHREADERLLPRLKLVIDRLIRDENVRYFYVGGYGGFDRIAARSTRTLPLCLCCPIIQLRERFRHRMDSTEHITLRDWKTPRGDMQLCVQIKLWSIPVNGWYAMFAMGPAIPEICWSMPGGEKQKG